MKIDLPVTIIFDCQAIDPGSIGRAAGHLVGTLRYETDGDGSDAVLFGKYPPDEKPFLCLGKMHTPEGEPAQAILSFIGKRTDDKIGARAARSPYDYLYAAVSDEERDAAQEAADAKREEDGA